MTWLLKLIRFPNLLIVVFTQYLIQYGILIPVFKNQQIHPTLDGFHFFFLVFVTILITASGYIINDLEDLHIDKINKPNQLIIDNKISKILAKRIYIFIVILGFLISIYLANHVGYLALILIYPVAIFFLYVYSKSLKQKVLLGNLVVAFFCAFVPGIVLFAERESFSLLVLKDEILSNDIWMLIGAYVIFAFLSTLFREIIKDIEDVEGDKNNDCQTLPIVLGMDVAKKVASLIGFILFGLLFWWAVNDWISRRFLNLVFLSFGVLFPLLYLLVFLQRAKEKKDFSHLSFVAKLVMLFGLVYLCVCCV